MYQLPEHAVNVPQPFPQQPFSPPRPQESPVLYSPPQQHQQQPPPQPQLQHRHQHHQALQKESSQVCPYWRRDGRCPMKGCPYAATHTAQNSPRYAKFAAPGSQAPVAEPSGPVFQQPQPAKRANALTIKDPSPPRTTPESDPVETPPSRSHALEIRTPKNTAATG